MSTYMYRLFDADDRLLYVGQSVRPMSRIPDHRRKPWGWQIARMDITPAMHREEALIEEAYAIRTENPLHNINRNNGSQHFGPVTPEEKERQAEIGRIFFANARFTEAANTYSWNDAVAEYDRRATQDSRRRTA